MSEPCTTAPCQWCIDHDESQRYPWVRPPRDERTQHACADPACVVCKPARICAYDPRGGW